MADISTYLAAIMAAIYGEQVRGSIHDAIEIINDVAEKTLTVGTTVHAGDSASGFYNNSLYINVADWVLLKSDGTHWISQGSIEGNGISGISGPVTSGLVDTYTINFTKDPTPKTFDVTNGKGIDRINGPVTVGLVDTYTIEFNDGTSLTYDVTNGADGEDGKTWLSGVAIAGKDPASKGYTIPDACKAGDFYMNVSEGGVYQCDIGAEANVQSYWSFKFAMTGGGGGVSFLYALTDVDANTVQNPSNGQVLKFNATKNKWEASSTGGGGHEMNPTPAAGLTEADVVSAVNAVLALQNPGNNDQVASVFSIGKWSNTMTKKYFVQGIAGSSTPIGKTGIGNWCVDGSDETGWISIPELVGIGSKNHTINITYDPSKSGIIIRGGYVIDDTTGKICIKFANEISEADTHTAKIGIEIIINNSESNPVS